MTKQVKVKENTDLSWAQPVSWGNEAVDSADILIPKLLLMQGLSEAVNEQKASLGDIVKSTTGQVVGGQKNPVTFIPLRLFKTWVNSEKIGNKFEYRGEEPFTAANQDAPLEWQNPETKTLWRRDRNINVYCLLPKDIEGELEAIEAAKSGDFPDPDKALMPCLVNFRRTSYQAGRTLATHFAKADVFKVPPAVTMFNLVSQREQNDQGTYYIYKCEVAGKTNKDFLATCKKWYEVLAKGQHKVHEVTEKEPTPQPASNSRNNADSEDVPF